MTVRRSPEKRTRAPLLLGCSPSPLRRTPALTSSSLYLPIAASSSGRSGVAGRNDCRCLDHKDNRAIRCSRPMHDTFGNDITFSRLKVDRLAFEVDDEVTVKDKEEFVVIVVLVPVIL